MGKFFLAIFFLRIVFLNSCYPQEQEFSLSWLPDFTPAALVVPSGSYLGLIGIGGSYLGYDGWYQVEFIYAYSPAVLVGRDIHVLSWRNSIHYYKYRTSSDSEFLPFIGLTAIYLLNPDSKMYFLSSPTAFPSNYYYATRGRLAVHTGGRYLWPSSSAYFSRYGCYLELAALDVYLSAAYYRHRGRKLTEIPSWGFGFLIYR